ncbi:Uncharacterized conserved protein YbjT, contains NAD(P)-binding and DUF2867 domains [Halomicrobium zhouii]|uniref:Uncharacterized conserved protein YbjT, contains NAD(P)-binding and DUF2867 domains n=1 Tax=Halomicrobium zhouii TaxID=767519 RepID=A0A1I6LCB9_9EURY|nr:NmrA family NAD(P)-binding protein [Halomicrobium zhouii]SFS01089.1 Uncharacterized conserved protein YbjT, contains NAD(P)-binding and DUF2867 domains [Halomicrobium zhouii]
MTVLVTGATGTVGSRVVAALAAADEPVRAAARDPDAARESLDADAVVTFDFEKPETWGDALDGVDRLFLVRPPQLSRVGAITDFVDAAERVGVDTVVVLSVLGAEKNPLLPHRRIERHVEGTGLDWTFVRASFFMQNFLEEHREEVRDGVLFVPAGEGETSFVDARDVADVAAAALTEPGHAGRAYDVTCPEALTYDEVAAVFSDVLGRPVTDANPSLPEFVWETYRRGTPLGKVLVMSAIYTTARFGLAGRVTDDVRDVLGRSPVDFPTFVKDHANDFAVERSPAPSNSRN